MSTQDTPQPPVIIKSIKAFIDQYTLGGGEDVRFVKDFKICETDEAIASLRAELQAVIAGKVATHTLDNVVGKKRVVKHGSYQAWAKAMILWLSIPTNS